MKNFINNYCNICSGPQRQENFPHLLNMLSLLHTDVFSVNRDASVTNFLLTPPLSFFGVYKLHFVFYTMFVNDVPYIYLCYNYIQDIGKSHEMNFKYLSRLQCLPGRGRTHTPTREGWESRTPARVHVNRDCCEKTQNNSPCKPCCRLGLS